MVASAPPATLGALAQLVRERVWAYLTAAAEPYDLAGVAEDLFQLPRGDVQRLAATHVGLSQETSLMLDAAEHVLRELPSTVAQSKQELRGAVRPPVSWRETILRRQQTSDQSLFVCSPPERRYDTPLARLLKLALARCADLSELAAFQERGPAEAALAERSAFARRLGHHVKLRQVRVVERPPAHALRGASRFARAGHIVDFLNLYREAVEEQDPITVREVVTRRLLIPTRPDKLLELFVGFQLIDALIERGYEQVEQRLLPGKKLPFAELRLATGGGATIWYQRALRTALPGGAEGRYRQTLASQGLRRSSLLPDFVVVHHPGEQVLLVEVKFTTRESDAPDQVGVKDVFAYLHDAAALLEEKPEPRALVIAWSSSATPAPADVMVAPHTMVAEAISAVLDTWLPVSWPAG